MPDDEETKLVVKYLQSIENHLSGPFSFSTSKLFAEALVSNMSFNLTQMEMKIIKHG